MAGINRSARHRFGSFGVLFLLQFVLRWSGALTTRFSFNADYERLSLFSAGRLVDIDVYRLRCVV